MDHRGLPMYQHPRMAMMGQSDISSVPGSIPTNYPMDNHALGNMGIQGAPMSGNHVSFNHKPQYIKMPTQQHYSQFPIRKEVDEDGRIYGVVLPKSPDPLPMEEQEDSQPPSKENEAAQHTEENDAAQRTEENDAAQHTEENDDSQPPNEENGAAQHTEENYARFPNEDNDSSHHSNEENDSYHPSTEENDSAHHSTEENDTDHNSTKENDTENLSAKETEIKTEQVEIKTEREQAIANFMEMAHDLFVKISNKEITIKDAAAVLERPYSFVYSRYQDYCDIVAGKVKVKKSRKGMKYNKGSKTGLRPKKGRSRKGFQCDECPAIFRTEYMIKAHAKVHLGNTESHLCTACGIVFPRLGQLMSHRIENHDDALQCPHCDKQYTAIKAYKFHVNTHSKVRPFPCEQCGKGFFSRVSLENHIRQHTGEKPFMCGYCEKVFTNLSNLKSHQFVHNGEKKPPRKKRSQMPKNFECLECGKRFESNNRLGQHMNTHTGAKPFACDLCDARFNLKANLYRHKLVHQGVKPFKCNYCPAAFLFKSELRLHDMSHTGLKPFKCHLCEYSCMRKHKLEYHINTHTGATPFKCDFYGCSAEYSSPSTLKQHKLKHGPPPLRTCKVCHEKFADLNSLKQHMMIHPGNKPVPCDQCDKIFFNESTLKRHMHVHMFKRHKNNVVIKRKRNPGLKKMPKPVPTERKLPPEYHAPPPPHPPPPVHIPQNGHSSIAQSWTINAEDTNSQNSIHNQQSFNHPFQASQFGNLNAWPSAVDPDELRRRLLSSFSNFNDY